MSRISEKALLGLDNTGSYWIIHNQAESVAPTFIISKIGPNISVEDLYDKKGELQSKKLQEIEARHFEKSWYIEDIRAFEAACGVACAQRLRENTPVGSTLTRRDWKLEDIDLTNGLIDHLGQASCEKSSPMSKRSRDISPEPQSWGKRRHLERDAPFFARADTYRPSYVRDVADVPPPTRTRRDPSFSISTPADREMHDGIGRSRPYDRSELPRQPLQRLRQLLSSTNESFHGQHHDSNATSRRLSGNNKSQSKVDTTGALFDFSGVPKGPKNDTRSRPPQPPHVQQKKYHEALDVKHPDVIHEDDLLRLKKKTHIFISSSHLPFLPSTIPHLHRLISKEFPDISVKAEYNGYYLVAPDDEFGREDLLQCFYTFNEKFLFNEYQLHMEVRTPEQRSLQLLSTEEGGGESQKTGKLLSDSYSRLDGPRNLVDGPSSLHLRPKADDEISTSSAAAPSEISSCATRAKTHCAECKTNHFPDYNQKFACSTCPRHYHASCQEPKPRISEDISTWQCNYCIKKSRPRPCSRQPDEQRKPRGSVESESNNLQNPTQDAVRRSVGQIWMGASPDMANGMTKGTQKGRPDALIARGEMAAQRVVLDSRLQSRPAITDPRLRDRVTVQNVAVMPSGSHENPLQTKLASEQISTACNSRTSLPLAAEDPRRMETRPSTQNGSELSGRGKTQQASVPNTQSSTLTNDSRVASSNQEDAEHDERRLSNKPLADAYDSGIEWLHHEPQQENLRPEIPDLSLDIARVSPGQSSGSPVKQSGQSIGVSAEFFWGKSAQTNSEEMHSQNKLAAPRPHKRNSLVRCSTCGKHIFSQSAKTDEPMCMSCKAKKQTVQQSSFSGPPAPETAEEFWRRRLQPVQDPSREPAAQTSKFSEIDARQVDEEASSKEQQGQGSHTDISAQHSEAQLPPDLHHREIDNSPENTRAFSPGLHEGFGDDAPLSPQQMDGDVSDEDPAEEEMPPSPHHAQGHDNYEEETVREKGVSCLEDMWEGESDSDAAAGQLGQAGTGGGPSFEASRLVRRAGSPVNENINSDRAGMGSDDACSAIGPRAAKDPRSGPDKDALSIDGSHRSTAAPAPSTKLPGNFSWPELIGFALVEASDHRMTAAQVHQWIVDNVDGYDIHNTTHRSSIAATLSQQKAKFPKDVPVMEGSRQLSRWKLAEDYVSTYQNELNNHRELLQKERALQGARNGSSSRRKDLSDPAKPAYQSSNTSNPRPAQQQKDPSKPPPSADETPMFIKRHRVAYDADGRDIVPGFKDEPVEKWTELAKVPSFRAKSLKYFVGDYIKAPLPNRFKFADYAHKPLVQTIAQIEEIRQRRDAPGYAVLVQWFVTTEAAERWKCRHVKSLWPKDDEASKYVPATVWHVLTSEFVAEQEKLDPEETKRQIIPDLFFDLDTDAWLLYLKEGRGPDSGPGIAFGPRSPDPKRAEAKDTSAGLDRLEERSRWASRNAGLFRERGGAQARVSLRPKSMAETNQTAKLQQTAKVSDFQDSSQPRKPEATTKAPRPTLLVEEAPIFYEKSRTQNQNLARELFSTPSPANVPVVQADTGAAERTSLKSPSNMRRSVPSSSSAVEPRPAKRQKTGVPSNEQAAVRAFLLNEQANSGFKTKDLFAAAPDLDPANATWDREAKIAEIKARPNRKARFSQNLAYVRHERAPHALHVEVQRPLPSAYKQPPASRPGSGHSGHGQNEAPRVNGHVDEDDDDDNDTWRSDADTDMPDAEATQGTASTSAAFTQTTDGTAGSSNTRDDSSQPELFDTLEELLDLPSNMAPTLYEGRLAFRDGTVGLDGRLPRAKKIFKVGRNVPGELK